MTRRTIQKLNFSFGFWMVFKSKPFSFNQLSTIRNANVFGIRTPPPPPIFVKKHVLICFQLQVRVDDILVADRPLASDKGLLHRVGIPVGCTGIFSSQNFEAENWTGGKYVNSKHVVCTWWCFEFSTYMLIDQENVLTFWKMLLIFTISLSHKFCQLITQGQINVKSNLFYKA